MLDHQQVVARRKQFHRKYDSAGDIEFNFSVARKSSYYEHNRDEFHFPTEVDGFSVSSPPLWKTNTSGITTYESSPLLPYNHQYSNFSPRTRSQAIAEGRRELMEMIHGMPESSYELSLKDIVDERQRFQEVKEEKIIDEKSLFSFESEAEIKKKKKKIIKPGQISRSASMDNETFLIKMFFPSFLASKKKATIKPQSKVSPRTSFEISENRNDRDQWIRRSLVAGENTSNAKSSSNSSSNSNRSTNRQADGNFSTGCWPLFRTKKRNLRRLRGCIF